MQKISKMVACFVVHICNWLGSLAFQFGVGYKQKQMRGVGFYSPFKSLKLILATFDYHQRLSNQVIWILYSES